MTKIWIGGVTAIVQWNLRKWELGAYLATTRGTVRQWLNTSEHGAPGFCYAIVPGRLALLCQIWRKPFVPAKQPETYKELLYAVHKRNHT